MDTTHPPRDPLDEVDRRATAGWPELSETYGSNNFTGRYGWINPDRGKTPRVPIVCIEDPEHSAGFGHTEIPIERKCVGCVGRPQSLRVQPPQPGHEPKLIDCLDLPTCSGRFTYKVATRRNVALWLAQRMTHAD